MSGTEQTTVVLEAMTKTEYMQCLKKGGVKF